MADTSQVTVGHPRYSDAQFSTRNTFNCSNALPLYCFGIDRRGAAYVPPGAANRVAFLSSSPYQPANQGRAQADAICAASAASAGLSGTFLALLATNTSSAASRFSVAGATWQRPDGVLLATSAFTFFNAPWLTGLNREASGGLGVANLPVWAGADGLTTLGTAATTCNDWSAAGVDGATSGSSQAYGDAEFGTGIRSCSSTVGSVRLYCLQQ